MIFRQKSPSANFIWYTASGAVWHDKSCRKPISSLPLTLAAFGGVVCPCAYQHQFQTSRTWTASSPSSRRHGRSDSNLYIAGVARRCVRKCSATAAEHNSILPSIRFAWRAERYGRENHQKLWWMVRTAADDTIAKPALLRSVPSNQTGG